MTAAPLVVRLLETALAVADHHGQPYLRLWVADEAARCGAVELARAVALAEEARSAADLRVVAAIAPVYAILGDRAEVARLRAQVDAHPRTAARDDARCELARAYELLGEPGTAEELGLGDPKAIVARFNGALDDGRLERARAIADTAPPALHEWMQARLAAADAARREEARAVPGEDLVAALDQVQRLFGASERLHGYRQLDVLVTIVRRAHRAGVSSRDGVDAALDRLRASCSPPPARGG